MNKIDYEILKYGLFDSTIKFPDIVTTQDRLLDCFEIELYISDCPGTAYINGTAYKLEKGLIICGKPGQYRHSRLHFKCCYLHLKVESSELYELLNGLADTLLITDYDELVALFYKMATHGDDGIADSLFLHSCADRILYTLIKLSKNRAPHMTVASTHIQALSDVKKYINNNYSEKLSLNILSEKAVLSPVYFHKLFTEYYGITPSDYILKIRISAAKQLLITKDDSLAKIAADCGFSSQSYFNYSFKKQTGLSPLKYRKKMLSQIDI